ncbi:MAG: TetR/AcrR family transcriptional regulator [Planctomycetota bacterium]
MPKKTSQSLRTKHKILQAATELFVQNGYGNTSLEDVAATAGVTKPTIYSHFGSKDRLLLAITEAHASGKVEAMSSMLRSTGDVRADLTRFGKVFLERVMGEQASCWHRLAMTESAEYPEIGQALFKAGPARVMGALQRFIQGEMTARRLNCTDASVAAEQFIGLLSGLQPIRTMTGQKPPSRAMQQRICDAAVDTFLAAFGEVA